MKRILVVGSTNTDMIIRVPRIPRPGETVLGGEFAMAPGGKGPTRPWPRPGPAAR
jgi:ribokinase